MKVRGTILVLPVLVVHSFFLPAQTLAQDTAGVGALSGTVVTSEGEPAIAATVCLIGTTRCALADDRGHFKLGEIRPGNYQLEVTPPGRARIISGAVDIRAGLDAVIEIVLPKLTDLQQSVTVTASAFIAPEEVKTSGFLIQRAEIQSSAGALADISRYLQALPGVALGTTDFRNDLIVRGGSPLENLFVVDNVEIPNINAFANFSSAGGTVGLLDAALLRDVTFLTGGYPASYGNRVSSVLQITQREGDRERFRARASLGFAGGGGVFEGPIGREGNGSWVVSLRRSFLDVFTDDIGIGGVPVLYTFNGKALVDLNTRDRVWFVSVNGADRVRLGLTEGADLDEQINDFDIRYEGWRSATGFNWQRIFGTRGVGLLGVSHSEASVSSQVKDLVRDGVPPPGIPVDDVIENGPVVFREGSREGETTVKYDLTTYLPMLKKVQAGGSVKFFRLSYDTASPLGNDSPFSAEPGVNPFALDRTFRTTQTGGYVQATTDLSSRVNVTYGARVDYFAFLGKSRVAPKAGASVRLTEKLSWNASAGQYYQQPLFLFLAAFEENARLDPIRADHFVTGLTYQMAPTFRVGIEAYRKNYRDYPVSSQFPSLSLANVGDTFNVREVLFPMASDGRGRATGVEILAEKKPDGRWYGQANLSFSRARHAGGDGLLRAGSYDYPFILNVDAGVQVSSRWQVTTRLAWLGGRPYTPFDEPASREAGRGLFDLTQVNGLRSPDYFRLDLRVERALSDGPRPLMLFAGVQNVTNRRNFSGYSWNRRQSETRFQEQMGLFPLVGFEWRF